VEEARLRKTLLSRLHRQEGQQLQDHLHLQGPQSRPRGGQAGDVQELRLQGVRQH